MTGARGTTTRGLALLLALGLLTTMGAACKSRRMAPPTSTAGQTAASAAQPKAPEPAKPATVSAAAPGEESAAATDQPAGEPAEDEPDRDRLWQCYQEVYCAQKKGQMDQILPLYKKYGFETPQEFTRVWIEAAKDTDWVTKLAHDVSKKCR